MTLPRFLAAASLPLALSACVTTQPPQDSSPYLRELPPGLVEIAAPDQDLTRVLIQEDDGCYWFAHDNIVETTYLPLRTVRGAPICARAQ